MVKRCKKVRKVLMAQEMSTSEYGLAVVLLFYIKDKESINGKLKLLLRSVRC